MRPTSFPTPPIYSHPMASSVSFLLFTAFLLTVIGESAAEEHLVGGDTSGWKVPSSTAESLNKWAKATRFQVGDSLLWKYDGKKDSVLQVTKRDYLSCNTSSPIKEHSDGHTVVTLHRPGAYYFIGGAEGGCEKGEKMIVVVMSPRHRVVPPAASPTGYDGPAVAPTSGGPSSVLVVELGSVALAAAFLVMLQS